MDVQQLGRAIWLIITVLFTVTAIVIAFLFYQKSLPTELQAWLETKPWQWVFSGIGTPILIGFFSLWRFSRSTPHAAVVKGSKSRKGGILAKSTDGGGAIVENSEAEQHIFAINQSSNTPPKT